MRRPLVPLDEHEEKVDKVITYGFFICLGVTLCIMIFCSIFAD